MRWLWRWGPAVAYMVAIFVVSGVPDLGPLPANTSDKVAHAAAYSLLGVLLTRAVAGMAWAGYTAAAGAKGWLIAAIYAATDETHQAFVPGRTPEVADWVADAAGAALGALAMIVLARILRAKDREV